MSSTVAKSRSESLENVPETFTELKNKIRERQLVEGAAKLLEKDYKLTRDEIAKKLGCAPTTLSEAFINEKQRGNKLLDFGIKAAVGIAGLGVLQNPDKIQNIMGDQLDRLIDNKTFTTLTTLFVVLDKYLGREEFMSFITTEAGSVAVASWLGTITLPALVEDIKKTVIDIAYMLSKAIDGSFGDLENKVLNNREEFKKAVPGEALDDIVVAAVKAVTPLGWLI